MSSIPPDLAALALDPRYQRLVRRRSALGWALSAVMLATYFGFILLVAFARPLLGLPLAGGATTVGIPLGLSVILTALVLTAIYVHRANRSFDAELEELLAERRS